MCWCRWNTHSQIDSHCANIQLFQQFWDKRLQGFQRHCCSPGGTCIATLTQRSLFVVLVLQAVPTRFVYTLTALLLCFQHFNIYSSHLLSKSTDREDSSFFFFFFMWVGRRCNNVGLCCHVAVMQMIRWQMMGIHISAAIGRKTEQTEALSRPYRNASNNLLNDPISHKTARLR